MSEEEDNIYDFKGISLDLDVLKIPRVDSNILKSPVNEENEEEDNWNPPIPPLYDVRDRLIQLNEELKREPNWTEREATKLKWCSELEQIKWFNGSTETNSTESSSSDEDNECFQNYEDYLNQQYRLSPTLLASITSESSSESSSISVSEKKDLSCYYSGTFFHLENANSVCTSPNCLSDHSKKKEQIPDIPVDKPGESKDISNCISLSNIQIELPNDPCSQENQKDPIQSNITSEGKESNLKHMKKRLSVNSLPEVESESKSSNSDKNEDRNSLNAFAQWKLKKKHEKLLSERLNYLKLQKRRNSRQRR